MVFTAINLTKLSQPELAMLLDVDPATIARWRKDEGMPVADQVTTTVKAGTPHFTFAWSQVRPWWLERENKKAVEKAMGARSTGPAYLVTSEMRKAAADAELAELKLAKARGEVMPISIFGDLLARTFTVARTRLLAVRDKVEGEIGADAAALVDREIRVALQETADHGADEVWEQRVFG
jgi:transcriptional regulator with XRE-family HTH domain